MKRRELFRKKGAVSLNSSNLFVGVYVSSSARKLEAVLVDAENSSDDSPVSFCRGVAFDLPAEIVRSYDELKRALEVSKSTDRSTGNCLNLLSELRIMLSYAEEEAIVELLKDSGSSGNDVVVVATSAPDIWIDSRQWPGQGTVFSLDDSVKLSQRTGFNVAEGFRHDSRLGSRRDLFLSPYWTLLGEPDRAKLVVDLGETARLFFLPPFNDDAPNASTLRFLEVGPCGTLLNAITKQITKGETDVDVGGKLSVQGRRVEELIDLWRDSEGSADFASPTESRYLEQLSNLRGKISLTDALCTSVHWIAELVLAGVDSYATRSGGSFEVSLMGGAKQNGLLFGKLSAGFAPRAFRPLDEGKAFSEDSFDATTVAFLGLLRVLGKPAFFREANDLQKGVTGRLVLGSETSQMKLGSFLATKRNDKSSRQL